MTSGDWQPRYRPSLADQSNCFRTPTTKTRMHTKGRSRALSPEIRPTSKDSWRKKKLKSVLVIFSTESIISPQSIEVHILRDLFSALILFGTVLILNVHYFYLSSGFRARYMGDRFRNIKYILYNVKTLITTIPSEKRTFITRRTTTLKSPSFKSTYVCLNSRTRFNIAVW